LAKIEYFYFCMHISWDENSFDITFCCQ